LFINEKTEKGKWNMQPVPYQPNSAPPQILPRTSLMVIYKKGYVMLHLEAEWTSKKYSNCRHNFGRTRSV